MKLFTLPCIVVFTLVLFPFAYSDPPKPAVNQERLDLLGKALSWLSLRYDGKLNHPAMTKAFLNSLHEEYNNSLYFRTIVIAFQRGVYPKLTLQQGQPCNPDYTHRYKSEMNNSVTWLRVKNFTLENYYDLRRPGSQKGPYCDYSKGLVCLPTTKICDCPEGSKLEQSEPNSADLRCHLEEDVVCPIPDLITYRDLTGLARKLPELVFNLEKPQSCKDGTTCRVKNSPFTRCLSMSKAPFQDPAPRAKYGEECVLDYLGEGDGCEVKIPIGSYTNSVCFNFKSYLEKKRLSTSGNHTRYGLCAVDVAPYVTPGIRSLSFTGPTIGFKYPFVNGFVNPGTVKMTSSELLKYDATLYSVVSNYTADRPPSWGDRGRITRIERVVGEPCSVSDTNKMIDIWNFYAGLEKTPPSGQVVVADIPTLNAKLEELKSLLDNHTDWNPKICRIFWEKGYHDETPPLTCVSTGAGTDGKGNDGTCQISSNRDTYALTLDVFNFRNDDFRSKNEFLNKDKYLDKAILKDNPELMCIQSRSQRYSRSGNNLNYQGRYDDDDRHVHGVVLEDASCSEGFGCVEDFSESHGIYKNPKNKQDCSFVAGHQPLYNCLNVVSDYVYIKQKTCEEESINKRVIETIPTAPRLAMGAPCSYQLVEDLKKFWSQSRWFVNRYRLLFSLQTIGICDQSKLLECNRGNICACRGDSAPRTTAEKKYTSDYCYKKDGECRRTVSSEYDNPEEDPDDYDIWEYKIPLTEAEKKEMDTHYGTSSTIEDTCENGNVCKFIDACTSQCIDANSGSTGYDVDKIGGCAPTTTTTTTTSTEKPKHTRKPLQPPRPFNAAELPLKKQSNLGKVLTMIIILNSFIRVI